MVVEYREINAIHLTVRIVPQEERKRNCKLCEAEKRFKLNLRNTTCTHLFLTSMFENMYVKFN